MSKLEELIAAHPKLFRGSEPAVPSYVPEGWYEIVDQLCCDIEALVAPEPERIEVRQIKEKFGGLRFYFAWDRDADLFLDLHGDGGIRTLVTEAHGPQVMTGIRALVTAASERSEQTCQRCGAPGTLTTRGGWVSTLCERHAAERA